MERRTLVLGLGLGLGGLGLGWALLAPESPEERIRRAVLELGESVEFSQPVVNPLIYGAHVHERWQELLAPEVVVTSAELNQPLPSARRDLAFAAAQLLSSYGSLDVDFGRLDVSLVPSPSARGVVTVTARRGDETQSRERPIRFEFVELDGQLRVSGIELGAPP